jgi:NAD(P)-dependent dehydrogenase (short-subunit alcohol dehydrogenase family)
MTRSVLITGGTGGLGAAVTNRFLEDGHHVVATSKVGEHPETVDRDIGHSGHFDLLQTDVTEWNSVSGLVEQVVGKLGTIQVLIHLVGGWAGGQPLQDVSLETWQRMFDLNLRSAFLCSRAVLPIMRQEGWGRIVFVSSAAARSGRRQQGPYAIAKAALSVLAETIAEENNDMDVTANVVAPSALDTPANRAALAPGDQASVVSVEDVAAMIGFLASTEAGSLRGAWLPAFGHA